MNMNKYILKKIMDTHIAGLFPGASVSTGLGNDNQRKYAVFSKGQTQIRVKEIDGESFFITRAQPFTNQELKIIHNIIQIADEYSGLNIDTQIYLNSNSLSRMVAKSLVTKNSDSKFETFLSLIVNTLETWSAQTYEGIHISTSFGVDSSSIESENNYDRFVKEDFAKVLSNGFDTIVEFSKHGTFLGHMGLNDKNDYDSTPYRYSSFAAYTAGNDKYAFILNRNGEILVFREGKLSFAKRRGEWRLFTHDAVLKQLSFGSRKTEPELQKAIYLSALDASFARCGGCIGFVQKSDLTKLQKKNIIKNEDWLESGDSQKTKALKKFIDNTKFHILDRRIRQEILGIDGATVVDYEGNILAVGAILNISQEETISAGGGARLAAARSLRQFGYSVKISEDGEIRAFGKSDKEFRFG
jgi:hypothetical protein